MLKRELSGKRLEPSYRRSVFVVHPGRDPMLECTCSKPASLKKLVGMMRRKNPNRVYVTDDSVNP